MSMNLPLPSSLVPISKATKGRTDIKPYIEKAINDAHVNQKIAPLLTNGLVEGHKLLDQSACLDIVLTFDKMHGNNIAETLLNRKEKIDQMMVCLRRFYQLDKKGKVLGPNLKRYAVITDNTSAQADTED